MANPHPGEILKAEFLSEIGMSQNQLANAISVPLNRIHAIVAGTRGITADTDLRLCKFFGSPRDIFCAFRTLSISSKQSVGRRGISPKLSGTKPQPRKKAA
jgi:addiction module HigA family antidote